MRLDTFTVVYLFVRRVCSSIRVIDIENSVNDLYEKATNLETMFLKCRLDLSRNLPDQLIKEVAAHIYISSPTIVRATTFHSTPTTIHTHIYTHTQSHKQQTGDRLFEGRAEAQGRSTT